jgi:LPXTG-site transpeptidase (sortase) family protein
MTAVQERSVEGRRAEVTRRIPRIQRTEPTPGKGPGPLELLYSYVLTTLAIVLGVLFLNLMLVSQFQHSNSQHRLYQSLRLNLAQGSTPIGQLDINGNVTGLGTPVALLKIPEIGLNEVVVEGAASQQTKLGVGHRPDTPLPGQPGISVLMGRAWSYGGPFGSLDKLKPGDLFTVVTQQGTSTFKVLGQRTPGEKLPVLTGTAGRLTLITAKGGWFMPSGTLTVDAAQVSKSFGRPTPAFASGFVPDSEHPMAGDPGRLFSLSWLLELLVIVSGVAVWAWKRWSHPAMWIVFAPVLTVLGLACADRICDLLPNLL